VRPPAVEAATASVAGALLGGTAGSVVGLRALGAVVGGANGLISGARRVYDWSSPKGIGAFALDSTWALATTAAGLACHGVALAQHGGDFAQALSVRQNRHVYSRGLRVRRGFAITVGNVVNGAGDVTNPRRQRLVTDHEDVHVWQCRWLGPLFPVLYGGWVVGGAIAGAASWCASRRADAFGKVVDTYAYYLNPFEWWAYSRDANWPPKGKLDGVGWQLPVVQSFASRRTTL